jgi:galactokinase
VLAFADALRRGSSDALGPLMLESHRSLAQDFEVSTPELDLLVGTFVEAGALGARMTGGGFGGCVVALAASDDARHVLATTTQRYRAATGLDSLAFVAHAAPGASTIDVTTADHPDQEHT